MVCSVSLRIYAKALWLWRSKHVLWYNMLTKMDLPDGYYYRGDSSTHCSPLKPDEPAFKYCEDLSSWELYGADGQVTEHRAIISCDSGRRDWNTVMGPLKNPTPRGSLWTYSPVSGKTVRLVLQDFP